MTHDHNLSAEQAGSSVPQPRPAEKDRKARRRQRVMNSRGYRAMTTLTRWMDRYYIDPIVGLIPGGWGDTLSAIMLVPFLWFSIVTVRSLPLTLAVVYNALRDMVVGLIPFFVGDVLDAFNHSYMRNMTLIQGFIDDDRTIVREVNRKAWFFAVAIALFIVAIVLLVRLTVYLFGLLGSLWG